ncbi:hypothetical protein [Burkholderia oklahomensis]|uniref:hypothetical protein n=1 Tax=Burkholderia oklahomensis TaxID=342113 RepID=UPI001E51A4EC|nr:hypothetical protein [Burkholderia oklahomensis]
MRRISVVAISNHADDITISEAVTASTPGSATPGEAVIARSRRRITLRGAERLRTIRARSASHTAA